MTQAIQSDFLVAAEVVRDEAARRAAETESARRVAPELLDMLVDAGFARHLVPTRWGGRGGSYVELLRAVATVGEGCASAAWIGAVLAILGRMAAHLPIAAQEALWQHGPDTRIAASVAPAGRVEVAPGGWRLSGEWTFASGASDAEWILLGGMAPGDPRPGYRFFLVPRRHYRVVDTWFNLGLRGTDSNAVVLSDVFVPAEFSYPNSDLAAGRAPAFADACHRVPFKAVNGLTFIGPALGAARAAIRVWSAWIADKRDVTGGRSRDSELVQLALARASARIDAAWLLSERAAAVADRGDLTEVEVVRGPRDFSMVADLLVAAMDEIFRMGGARGQADGSVVQRAWRDVHSAASHFALRFGPNAQAYAAHVFNQMQGAQP